MNKCMCGGQGLGLRLGEGRGFGIEIRLGFEWFDDWSEFWKKIDFFVKKWTELFRTFQTKLKLTSSWESSEKVILLETWKGIFRLFFLVLVRILIFWQLNTNTSTAVRCICICTASIDVLYRCELTRLSKLESSWYYMLTRRSIIICWSQDFHCNLMSEV